VKESTKPVALTAMVVLSGALGAVVILGRGTGPSTPGSSQPASGASAAPQGSAAVTQATGSGASAPAAPADGFVPTPDWGPEAQTILERINEVRANPQAHLPEWKKLLANKSQNPCGEPESMLDPIKAYAPRQPLAPNEELTVAARGHAQDMIKRKYFEHENPDGLRSNRRAINAGYPLPVGRPLTPSGGAYGEGDNDGNIESLGIHESSEDNRVWDADTWAAMVDGLIVDACVPSRGHREHLLATADLRQIELEIGVGFAIGPGIHDGMKSAVTVAVEIAHRADDTRFVTGVAYKDANGNDKYDFGEGLGDIEVTIANLKTKTNRGGGYALPVPKGFKGKVVAGNSEFPVEVGEQNVKVDFKGK